MARIVATFGNGQTKIIKNSRRNYSHAWRWWAIKQDGTGAGNSGFCSGYVQGMKASASDFNFHNNWLKKDGHGELRNFEFEIVTTTAGAA